MEQKTLDRLLALPRNPRSDSDFSDSDRQFVDALHRSILGSPVRDCSCRNRYTDAYYEIMAALPRETRKLFKMSKGRKYRLIGGYVIYHEGSHYTNVTLTDEIAKAYLEKHPDAISQFESIPEPEVQELNPETIVPTNEIEEAKEFLKKSEADLEKHQSEIQSEEKRQLIIDYQDTLREAIQGGDINSISSAVYGLKTVWESAFEPVQEQEKKPEPEPAEQPKEKKSKK